MGGVLGASPWSGDLPVGSLLFLADANVGPGVTHVSIYAGGGLAADCYNEKSGCVLHDVRNSAYYRDHWVYASYPWGDTPVYGSGPSAITNTGPVGGNGWAQVGQIIGAPGPLAGAVATPIASLTEPVQRLEHSATALANDDPSILVEGVMGPIPTLIGYVRFVDSLFSSLRLLPMLALSLVVMNWKWVLAVVRYIIGLSPL
jgi:hypothetical protein